VHEIASLGMGRTFQNLAMFRTMSVRDNVMIGAHCRSSAGFLASALRLPSVGAEEKRLRDRADEIMDYLKLTAVRRRAAGDLPFGIQKRVELGRALAADPKLLLLDEPAAGLNHEELDGLGDLIRDVREPHGHHRAAGRAPHEPGDGGVRPHRGAELRQEDRRRHARPTSRTTPT
jgi:branched-chain amino acid transport system ATP-binding protein